MANRIAASLPPRKAAASDDPSLVMVEVVETAKSPDGELVAKQQAFLTRAKTQFHTAEEAEGPLRKRFLDDYQFFSGEQWDPQTIADRQSDDRPVILINRIRQFVRQVTNANRQANMSVKILPVDDAADVKTAEVLQGLIRHIEQQSDAKSAYATASEHQAIMGRGWWRVVTEFENETDFTAAIRIKRVRNPFSIFVDPAAMEADYSDARFMFVIEDIPKDEYKARFGDASFASLTEFETMGNREPDWMPEGKVRIAEYWYVEQTEATLLMVQMPDGQVLPVFEDELPNLPTEGGEPQVINLRKVQKRQVKSALINAKEILEGNDDLTAGRDWPGQWIPIVAVLGDELDVNGEVDLRGMVRDAKDPQRLYNYQNTALAETLALVPRAPFIGYEGQFRGHEAKWRQANRRNFPYLEVSAFTLDGKPAPLPQRISAGADVGAIMTAIQQSDQDLKATMGLYEPSLGIRESEQSGKAINALQKQGELANSNFQDNLARAIRFTGRIIVDLAPHVYDALRVMRIVGSDDVEKKVMLHANAPQQLLPPELPDGIQGIYNIGVGRYDIVVKAGPSTDTKRQEAFIALSTFVQAYPQAFPLVGDLLMGALDWPGAHAAAERLKRAVPPQVLAPDDGGTDQAQMAAQLQQVMTQLEQANVSMQEMQGIIEGKKLEQQTQLTIKNAEIASRERIESLKVQASQAQIQTQGQVDAQLLILEARLKALEQQLEHAHDRAMSAQDRADDRVDAAVTRHADRQDDAATRHADRQDFAMERLADRADTAESRYADRQDAAVERHAARFDDAAGAAREEALASADHARERQVAGEERQRDRQDAAEAHVREQATARETRQFDREDAAAQAKHDLALAKAKPKGAPKK